MANINQLSLKNEKRAAGNEIFVDFPTLIEGINVMNINKVGLTSGDLNSYSRSKNRYYLRVEIVFSLFAYTVGH